MVDLNFSTHIHDTYSYVSVSKRAIYLFSHCLFVFAKSTDFPDKKLNRTGLSEVNNQNAQNQTNTRALRIRVHLFDGSLSNEAI